MSAPIFYREGYQYQLVEQSVWVRVPELAGHEFQHPYFNLRDDGMLYIGIGYAWDGLTGAIDDRRSLSASLVHDVVCQAVNEGLAPVELRARADRAFRRIMLANGVWSLVAWWRYRAVRRYRLIAGRKRPRPILEAPGP